MLYDDIDLRNERNKAFTIGFWIGAAGSFILTVALLLYIGLNY